MSSLCPVIITKGKNKGQTCGEVNKYCRHRTVTCEACGKTYTRDNSYARHLKTCQTGTGDDAEADVDDASVSPPAKPSLPPAKIALPAAKIKIEARLLTTPKHDVLDQLINEIRELRDEIHSRPEPVNISNTFNFNLVVGNNFYDELVEKMGKEEALKYIVKVASQKTPLDIINKLYLEGVAPANYPIACRDNDHFRFANAERKIVDDVGGRSLANHVSNGLLNTFLIASNELIAKQMSRQTEITDDDMEDFMNVQTCATSKPSDWTVTSELSRMTTNLNHPFWHDPGLLALED